MTANNDIRRALRASGVTQWRLAQLLDVSEATITRRLREELEPEERDKILALIREEAARDD